MFEKIMKFVDQLLRSRTIVFMVAAAVVPVLVLLEQVDLQSVLAPVFCGESLDPECVADTPAKVAAAYAAGISAAGVFFRWITESPLFKKTTFLTSE